MAYDYLLLIAFIQGITEFLPISSSSHLILIPILSGHDDQGLTIDIAVHFGSLFAVMIAMRHEIYQLFIGGYHIMINKRDSHEARLCLNIIIATIPIIIAGFFLKNYVESTLRNIEVIAYATLAFGILLYFADIFSMTIRNINKISSHNALMIGIIQILALIPGASRAGVTITAARFMGMERKDAARFSMLLSIPTILGATVLSVVDMSHEEWKLINTQWVLAALFSFICALLSIKFLLAWLNVRNYTIFVLYRLLLGSGLLYLIHG